MRSKNNRSIDTPVKGPPQGPRLHIDIPRVQLLIEDKEGIKQIGTERLSRGKRCRLPLLFTTRCFARRRQGSGSGDGHGV